MKKFSIEGNNFIINAECSIIDFMELKYDFEQNIQNIKNMNIIVKADVDINIMYFLKTKEQAGFTLTGKVYAVNIPKIKAVKRHPLPSLDYQKAVQMINIFKKTELRNDRFWLQTFLQTIDACFFQNAIFFCSMTFLIGFACIALSYRNLQEYSLEMHLIRLSARTLMDAVCPIVTCVMIIVKFSAPMTAMIKFKDINYELKTLHFFNLSVLKDYMNAIVIGCVVSAVLTHFTCLLAGFCGAAAGWKLYNSSLWMYLNEIHLHLTGIRTILSFIKVFFSAFWIGLITCISGVTEGKSVLSIFESVESMVVVAFSGMLIIQILLTFLQLQT